MTNRPQFREITLPSASPALPTVARTARLPQFLGCKVDAEKILGALRVAIVGLGSIGGRVAAHLARLQVASLHLADPKRFKPESLLTHELNPTDLGEFKSVMVARRCKEISPTTRVLALTGGVEDWALGDLTEMSLVVMATDDLSPELETGGKCARLGKKLIQGSVHGETLCAQVRVFSNATPQSPCAACLFNETEWTLLNQRAKFSCQGNVAGRPVSEAVTPPTMSHSALCALAADLVVNQILRLVLKLGEPVEDTIVEYCGYTNRIVTSKLIRNSKCPIDHTCYALAHAPQKLTECSLEELATTAGVKPHDPSLSFIVEDFVWLEKAVCQCTEPRSVRQFVSAHRKNIGRCAKCHAPFQVQPFYFYRAVPSRSLGTSIAVQLGKLGARTARAVLIQTADQGVLILDSAAD